MMYAIKILFVLCEYVYRAPAALAFNHIPYWLFDSIILAHALKSPFTSLTLALDEARHAGASSKRLQLALSHADVARQQLQSLLFRQTNENVSTFSVFEEVSKIGSWYLSNGKHIEIIPSSPLAKKCTITGSKFLFEQLIQILVNNSIRATYVGSIIVISLSVEPNNIYLLIQDFGTGMSKLDLALCMMIGYSKSADGWGIGLSCARRIVNDLHGQLRIHSCEHVGTQIICTIPKNRE